MLGIWEVGNETPPHHPGDHMPVRRTKNGTRVVRKAANDNHIDELPEPGKRKVKTTKINGKRVRVTTSVSKGGVVSRKVGDAPVLEWRLQAAITRRFNQMIKAGMNFTFAGDMNGLPLFGSQAKVKAKATGMMAGEHDMRVYMPCAQLGLIEVKEWENTTSAAQIDRHALLDDLGFTRQAIIRVKTEQEAADAAEAIVLEWLGDVRKSAA